jgi:hypothetical protein
MHLGYAKDINDHGGDEEESGPDADGTQGQNDPEYIVPVAHKDSDGVA